MNFALAGTQVIAMSPPGMFGYSKTGGVEVKSLCHCLCPCVVCNVSSPRFFHRIQDIIASCCSLCINTWKKMFYAGSQGSCRYLQSPVSGLCHSLVLAICILLGLGHASHYISKPYMEIQYICLLMG